MVSREPNLKDANYECFILALSLLSQINLLIVVLMPLGETADIVRTVDVGLSIVLLLDFCYRLFGGGGSRYFIHEFGWLDLIGSLPIMFLRPARLYRMIVVTRTLHPIQNRLWRTILRDRAGTTLFALLFLVVLLMEIASSAVLSIEGRVPGSNIKTASDALWWTWVSVATVGYGDRYPVTDEGRVVGFVTIAVGVALYGAITGFLANFFLRPNARAEQKADEIDERLKTELGLMRAALRAMQSRADGVDRRSRLSRMPRPRPAVRPPGGHHG